MPRAISLNNNLVGEIKPMAGNTVDQGFLPCDGSVVAQATYPALYAKIGSTYNTGGEGAGNFRLPDCRGRSLIGEGTGVGLTARTVGQQVGAETHTLIHDEMPPHQHIQGIPNVDPGVGAYGTVPCSSFPASMDAGGPIRGHLPLTAIAGVGTAHNNMQPSLVVKFQIRY